MCQRCAEVSNPTLSDEVKVRLAKRHEEQTRAVVEGMTAALPAVHARFDVEKAQIVADSIEKATGRRPGVSELISAVDSARAVRVSLP